ncbi:hypothetical protein CHU93_00290 [Sandarakinorhabdus cyanobacteriorum]|uniref:HTH lysR-type domain-containing protein n=1 Tax=Sandarakinorhabdus cyanobacteriorum TaxID=1981098 RepID=A0A255Z8I6_9SPHN|nr:LysR family transcriptional regulator [Sandarakinorhabdus cyanobacteriorum]OYQ37873.1 hypothetical protein CHU93_00290 [Sandarakinorhabdus cyanobacteriorum]
MNARRPALSIDALVVLDAVARHQSLARAAVELNRVPSALSYTMCQLEQRMGLALFHRSKRNLTLTEAGIVVLEDGRRLLRAAHDIESRVRQLAKGWEVELRIAVDTIFGPQMLFPLLTKFDGLQSDTRISVLEEAVSGCWDALVSDRADLVVAGLGTGGVPFGGGYQIHALGSLAFDFAVAPWHPLVAFAGRSSPITDDELRTYRVVSVADSAQIRPAGGIGLLAGQNKLTVTSMRDKLAAQLAGLGVGFLPRYMAEPEFAAGRLVKLDVQQPRPLATFCIAHRHDRLGRAGEWFVDQIRGMPTLLDGLMPLNGTRKYTRREE